MMQPARGVSGDYYDYIPIDEHTSKVVIADVSGKAFRCSADVRHGSRRSTGATEKRDMLDWWID